MRTVRRELLAAAILALSAAAFASRHEPTGTGRPPATRVSLDGQGHWSVTFQRPAWTFGGQLGAAVSAVETAASSDAIGPYHETTFSYRDTCQKTGAIRAYDAVPVVLFTQGFSESTANQAPFPTINTYPQTPYHLAYGERAFAPHTFEDLAPDSPWIFFDQQSNAFIVSAANHFMNASMALVSGVIQSGIAATVTSVPAGFVHQTLLVAEPGINRAFDTWGHALTSLTGKKRPANDATPELARLGYWTDAGATYYYRFDQKKGSYPASLLAVRDDFQQQGLPLAYMQLDSWWYPKGPDADWHDSRAGEATYGAAPALFPAGLPAFQQQLGLPLITHARWIDPSSPYRTEYEMSDDVSTDPRFWEAMMTSIRQGGVVTYEQDWLDHMALPRTDNLVDQDAFMDNMALAAQKEGLTLQYCMALPRHFLQGAKYDNLLTMRVSGDRFDATKWTSFLYGSRLAGAVAAWPWADVFMSTEEENLILATLSGGMVGVGDPIGAVSTTNLHKAVRPDGVIVKPDVPIVPLDDTVIHDAQGAGTPVVAWTHTDSGNGLIASYVFSYSVGADVTASFSPAALGYEGQVYVYSHFQDRGRVMDAAGTYREDVIDGRAYDLVVPVGASGIAFLGDAGKYAALGRQRIRMWDDKGNVSAIVTFADGEDMVTLHGYAPEPPVASASVGSVGPLSYNAGSHLFTVPVSPAFGASTAIISIGMPRAGR